MKTGNGHIWAGKNMQRNYPSNKYIYGLELVSNSQCLRALKLAWLKPQLILLFTRESFALVVLGPMFLGPDGGII